MRVCSLRAGRDHTYHPERNGGPYRPRAPRAPRALVAAAPRPGRVRGMLLILFRAWSPLMLKKACTGSVCCARVGATGHRREVAAQPNTMTIMMEHTMPGPAGAPVEFEADRGKPFFFFFCVFFFLVDCS